MHKPIYPLLFRLLILAVALTVVVAPSTVHAEQPDVTAPTAQTAPALSAEELQAFFDDYLGTQMATNHVAGMAVAVVKDGQVLFTKGYGYADIAQQIPVDPDKTIFILGSLSKVFTWTAIMQLVEQGKVSLDADVNTYLDFHIPDTYPQPITLNHLMAHNAGFEDRKYAQMAPANSQPTPLGDWLKTHIPARVRPPSQFSAYENYGATLTGYIIERVSGLSYADYMEQNILAPLGMSRTSVHQPFPAALNAEMTQSYAFVNGAYQPQPDFNVIANVAPAGAFRSTAADMTRFMIAHLNDGHYGDASILQPETAQLMHTQSFAHDPQVNGMAHGFWELDINGQHIIGHAGSHFIFSSLFMLFPADNLGVFITANSQGSMAFLGGENYSVFERAFVDHFFPQNLPTVTNPADFAQRADRFSGSYGMTMGQSETTPEKLASLLMAVDVQPDKDGLIVPMLGNARFVEVEPLVFRQVDDDTRLVFKEDAAGNITQAFLGPNPQSALIKNRWFETLTFNLFLLAASVILFLSVLVAALVSIITRRRANSQPVNKLERVARLVAVGVSLFSLLVLIGAFLSILMNPYGLYTGTLPLWPLVTIFSAIVVLLALVLVGFTILAWVRHFWGLSGRIHYTFVTLGALSFVWFMYFWNILGKSF
ncbi:MAG TPA: serine hydrolase domain-containing protein [Phototrophicaceae bacterium]|nr:serine hydrolase domain-containing protein [Phototrophicaceae bacterium]